MIASRPVLNIVGVSHISDLYPNVKYRLDLLAEVVETKVNLYDLGGGILFRKSTGAGKLRFLAAMIWGHFRVLTRLRWKRNEQVYVVYPAVFIVLIFLVVPAGYRPRILLDAFISIYDTIVNDRVLFSAKTLRGRAIYLLERMAFAAADVVVVDTPENAKHYSDLFGLPLEKFVAVPLAIPPLETGSIVSAEVKKEGFSCLFMGSMVPLHGIDIILKTVERLSGESYIHFVIIGDGQQSRLIYSYLRAHRVGNLRWERRMLPTRELIAEMESADLCLGIFGVTAKADRVLPYKIYYYAALGKPFLTLDSTSARRVASPDLICTADPDRLAERIVELSLSREILDQCASSARVLHEKYLSRSAQLDCWKRVLNIADTTLSSPALGK